MFRQSYLTDIGRIIVVTSAALQGSVMHIEKSAKQIKRHLRCLEQYRTCPASQVKRRPSATGLLLAPTQMALCLRLAYIDF